MHYFAEALAAALGLIFSFDPEVYRIAWTSVWITVVATVLAGAAGVPLGIFVALHSFRGKQLLLQALNTMMALPTVVVGLLLYGMFTRHGPLGSWGLLYTPTAVIIGQCVLILPIVWNLCVAAAAGADPRLRRTCLSLGAGPAELALMFISEVRFALLAALAAGFGRAIGEVGVAMMLGGNIAGFTRTMTTAIALETSKGEFEFALALGLLLLLIAFVANGALQRLQRLGR